MKCIKDRGHICKSGTKDVQGLLVKDPQKHIFIKYNYSGIPKDVILYDFYVIYVIYHTEIHKLNSIRVITQAHSHKKLPNYLAGLYRTDDLDILLAVYFLAHAFEWSDGNNT